MNGKIEYVINKILEMSRHIKIEKTYGQKTYSYANYYEFTMEIDVSRGTPMFPLEVFRQKEVREISEKNFAVFLSKNFDNNY